MGKYPKQVFWSDEDEGYIATLPDLPGCSAWGATEAEAPEELNIPGYVLHKLIGNKKDYWSLKVSGNWRITFKFECGHALEVNLEDYH